MSTRPIMRSPEHVFRTRARYVDSANRNCAGIDFPIL